jgi:DNA-binding NarL/FixJ family response regulator
MLLVATQSASLQEGLLALLAAITTKHPIAFASSLTEVLKKLAESPLDLIVLDADLLTVSTGMVLGQIKRTSSATRLLLLTDTVQQQQAMAQFEVEAVLLKGTSAAEIASAIEQLLAV